MVENMRVEMEQKDAQILCLQSENSHLKQQVGGIHDYESLHNYPNAQGSEVLEMSKCQNKFFSPYSNHGAGGRRKTTD